MTQIDIIKKRLSEEIKQCRKTQKEIATQLNIDQANISNYIRGKQVPTINIFAKLCIALDLDANYILGITDYAGKKTHFRA